jgi:DNA primase
MAEKIPSEFIHQLIQNASIVDVIDSIVPLKKVGANYKACCPFHEEKTPSFVVSEQKQIFHCFGCGMGGSVLTFIMEYERMHFVEAVHRLADILHLSVPVSAVSTHRHKGAEEGAKQLVTVMDRAAQFYQQQLKQGEYASSAQAYLKQRGLTGETALRFRLGVAPKGWDSLIKHMGASQRALLEQGGLLTSKGSQCYDRFRDRIMFPIREPRQGRVIAFGGRVMGHDEPKYLNSPETSLFHKSKVLYGLYELLQACRRPASIIVVEGYMDVLALAQHGISSAVASLGTATTVDHLHLLFRYTDDVYFCFDGDAPGREAAWRAACVCLPLLSDERTIRFIFLPQGDDPDTVVNRGGMEAFTHCMAQALSLSSFFMRHLSSALDLNSMEGRARLLKQAQAHLKQVPESHLKQLLIAEIAAKCKVPMAQLLSCVHDDLPVKQQVHRAKQSEPPSLLRQAIRMLLQWPALAVRVSEPLPIVDISLGHQLLQSLLNVLHKQSELNTAMVLELLRDHTEAPLFQRLASEPMLVEEGMEEAFDGCIQKIRCQALDDLIDQLMAKVKSSACTQAERQQLLQLQQQRKHIDVS